MTEKEMIVCYDALIDYRKDEDILRIAYFKDRNMGTHVNFYVGEYKVTCQFFCTGKDNWELCINASLKTDWANQFLNHSKTFTQGDTFAIPDTIDALIRVCQSMPPMFSALKAEMQRNLEAQGSDINLYD